jgi:hypothetical protein
LTLRVVFDDRADAEASVERVQAKHPVRYRWPLGHFRLPGVPAPSRDKVAPMWWMRWDSWLLPPDEWERTPAFQCIDFADFPEACLVPVHVV